MKVIRGETVQETLLLTPKGELLEKDQEKFIDLVEEECRKSFQKGQDKGEKVGYYKALEESKLFLTLLQTVTRRVLEQKNRLLDQLKPEIIEFAMSVCEQVLRKELSQPQTLVRLIHSLLAVATPPLKEDTIKVVLAPDDFLMLEKNFDHIHYDKKEVKEIRFVSDPLMRRGDCRIETTSGLLNYDISRELNDLQAKVLQR
ncbi:MAG: hypothetical protein S4CHLAM2_11810 [Chlamydiales bacterium]|nr:hypothetical protein [Chlamydiales bacterium]